jgi:hypothetical protein
MVSKNINTETKAVELTDSEILNNGNDANKWLKSLGTFYFKKNLL